ncbi:MAG: HAD family hydrolase [Pseudomonadota bacterium]
MTPTIAGVLFDKDGTLFDFDATWTAWAGETIRRYAGGDDALAQAFAEALGYDLHRSAFFPTSSVIAGTVDEQAEAIAPLLPGRARADIARELNTLAANAIQQEVVPLPAFLAGLKARGLKLGVATNDAESSAIAHLSSVQALDPLDFVAGYDSGFGHKPGPGPLLAFCDHVGLAAAACVMVGDSTHDLLAGRAAGMRTVAVLTGPATADTLAPHADVVLPSIAALPDWLSAQAPQSFG